MALSAGGSRRPPPRARGPHHRPRPPDRRAVPGGPFRRRPLPPARQGGRLGAGRSRPGRGGEGPCRRRCRARTRRCRAPIRQGDRRDGPAWRADHGARARPGRAGRHEAALDARADALRAGPLAMDRARRSPSGQDGQPGHPQEAGCKAPRACRRARARPGGVHEGARGGSHPPRHLGADDAGVARGGAEVPPQPGEPQGGARPPQGLPPGMGARRHAATLPSDPHRRRRRHPRGADGRRLRRPPRRRRRGRLLRCRAGDGRQRAGPGLCDHRARERRHQLRRSGRRRPRTAPSRSSRWT